MRYPTVQWFWCEWNNLWNVYQVQLYWPCSPEVPFIPIHYSACGAGSTGILFGGPPLATMLLTWRNKTKTKTKNHPDTSLVRLYIAQCHVLHSWLLRSDHCPSGLLDHVGHLGYHWYAPWIIPLIDQGICSKQTWLLEVGQSWQARVVGRVQTFNSGNDGGTMENLLVFSVL